VHYGIYVTNPNGPYAHLLAEGLNDAWPDHRLRPQRADVVKVNGKGTGTVFSRDAVWSTNISARGASSPPWHVLC